MIRFLAQSALTLIGNAIGLLVAAMLLSDFRIDGLGFTISIVFFTVAQIVLAPFILKLAVKHAPAFRGGIALVTTFVVLLLTTWLTDGLRVNGIATWIAAPLIIWLATVIAGIFLPMVLFKKAIGTAKDNRSSKS